MSELYRPNPNSIGVDDSSASPKDPSWYKSGVDSAGVIPLSAIASLFRGVSRSGKPLSTPWWIYRSFGGGGRSLSPLESGCSAFSESNDLTDRRRESLSSCTMAGLAGRAGM